VRVAVTNGRSAGPSGAHDRIGTILGDRYRILELIGRGGMGDVYRAEHVRIGKIVAVKVIAEQHRGNQFVIDRFLQEARTASMIRNEHVVDITDFGETPDGSAFFAMEFLEGEDLEATLGRERRIAWPRARDIVLQICTALSAAHACGVVHRDVKPANCFIGRDRHGHDVVRMVDFGIAKVFSEGARTHTGAIFGTPAYMAPEQARGLAPDARADVYAVGIVLYELLTGRVPFDGESFMGVLTAHILDPVPSMQHVAPDLVVAPALEAVVLAALQKDRDRRCASVEELARMLSGIGDDAVAARRSTELVGQRRPTTRVTGFALAATAAAWILVGVWLATETTDDETVATRSPPAMDPSPVEPPSRLPTDVLPGVEASPRAVEPQLVPAAKMPSPAKPRVDRPKRTPAASARVPRKLEGAQIQSVLARAAAKIERCFATSGGWTGMKVPVEATIAATGTVASVTMHGPDARTPVGRCLHAVVASLRFPEAATKTSFRVPLVAK
jgi:serine/threonine protein kinase